MDGHSGAPTGEGRLQFAPAPSGYDDPFETGRRPPPDMAIGGLVGWLFDFGHDLTGDQDSWTCRWIAEVVADGGLQGASNFSINFDPSFEQGVVHAVRVFRDGVWRNVADPSAFQILRREPNLERAQFDGSITAVMVIPDLRIGDVVETCYSIVGSNPALKGRFSVSYAMQWGAPGVRRRYRLVTKSDRSLAIAHRGEAPVYVEEVEAERIIRDWILRPALSFQYEPDTPSWWIGHTELTVADQMTWSDVADLFRPYYETPKALPETLEAEAIRIEAATADPAERVLHALRLIQSQVRYHSFAIGEGGYVPRPTDEIWATRFGDCKDASRILTALLCRLGIDAVPALVNTANGEALDGKPPAVRAFNHCIVRVRLGGSDWWLDPTRAAQAGTRETMTPVAFGYGLPLEPKATLISMGAIEPVTVLDIDEKWDFGAFAISPAEAVMTTVLGSWRADDIRNRLANDGHEAIAKQYLTFSENHFGEIAVRQPTEFVDDQTANTVTVTEYYTVKHPWRGVEGRPSEGVFRTVDDVVGPHLVVQESAKKRVAPVDLGTPRRVVSRKRFDFGFDVPALEWDRDWKGPGVTYKHRCQVLNAKVHEVSAEMVFSATSVPASDAAALYDFCAKARSSNGYTQVTDLYEGRRVKTKQNPQEVLRWVWPFVVLTVLLVGMCSHGSP